MCPRGAHVLLGAVAWCLCTYYSYYNYVLSSYVLSFNLSWMDAVVYVELRKSCQRHKGTTNPDADDAFALSHSKGRNIRHVLDQLRVSFDSGQ